ncbi:MAG TPA: hypothetical protein VN541_06810 [Tepidisphaeraceae bacterium]|nr:hypothetical protein [Tepidisphaeraceae bacterium]
MATATTRRAQCDCDDIIGSENCNGSVAAFELAVPARQPLPAPANSRDANATA